MILHLYSMTPAQLSRMYTYVNIETGILHNKTVMFQVHTGINVDVDASSNVQ